MMKRILKPLASLWLTVPLLLLSMLLVYAGTTVQRQMSSNDVQKQFFHSWLAWAPLDPMLRPFASAESARIPGSLPLPGGYTLIALLLANLVAAHSVRFKLRWKRSGIILIHLGLIMLLVGEICASLWSVESQMQIDQGQTVQYTQDIRHVELAVIDPSPADHDNVTVIDASELKPGATIATPSIPFEVRVKNYFANSSILGPVQDGQGAIQAATAGKNKPLKVVPEPKIPATDGEQTDVASAFLSLRAGGKDLGTYLVSQYAQYQISQPETVDVDGRPFRVELRFRRYYKPYKVTLLKFSHERYEGTDTPSNFASRVRLVDPSRNVDREVVIWMNHPLTYRGETFYQQSFRNEDKTTVLQVTHNPGWPLPYLGLALGLAGLLIHFGMHLIGFLRRVVRSAPAPAPASPSSRMPAKGSRLMQPAGSSYTLAPRFRRWSWVLGISAAALVGVSLISSFMVVAPLEDGFDLGTFATLPVMQGGRVMPLDSLARTTLKIISGRDSYEDSAGNRHPAIRWLADTLCDAPGAMDQKVIEVDFPDILTQLGLDPNRKFFSLSDLLAHKDTVQQQFDLAIKVPEKQQDLYQKHIVELARHVEQYLEMKQAGRLLLVPPQQDGGDWLPLVSDRQLSPGANQFLAIVQAYHDRQPHEFNTLVAEYHHALQQQLPRTMAKVDYEASFDHAEPFFLCLWIYVGVFALACCSWLGFRKPLWAIMMGVLLVTFGFHTYGLASRVYLTGRPPITNLYSSALFIAWAIVLLAIVLEFIFRIGIGAAVAAIAGFGSLIIAHYLGNDGDTMKPVQAVLATNFWLWTHVPCVALGYASTFFAGLLAAAYIVLGIFTPALGNQSIRKTLASMVYGIVCFAILFSFVGTILGGIWADYSWGRFWGWDPKENGAILIVLWNAVILHARWGGIVRERGMMVLALVGNIVTAWSWFGTNMLGFGLHSYGHMEGAETWLLRWIVLQVALILVGLTPKSLWRSLASAEDGRPVTTP